MTDELASERTLKLLEDIRSTAQHLINHSRGREFGDLLGDIQFRFFVERSFEIMGEAARRLRDENTVVASNLTGIEKIIATRNVIVYGYDGIDYRTLWQAVNGSVSLLIDEVTMEMQTLGS